MLDFNFKNTKQNETKMMKLLELVKLKTEMFQTEKKSSDFYDDTDERCCCVSDLILNYD